MIYVFKYAADKVNAAISTTSSLYPEVNSQVVLPSIHDVKAVARMPRVMRAQIEFRAFMRRTVDHG